MSAELRGPRGARWRCDVPTTRRERARGLLGRSLATDEALLLERCTSVHTFGMRGAIMVARLSKDLEVRDVRVMAPGRLLAPTWRRGHVLECAPGADLRVGDVLEMVSSGARGRSRRRASSRP
jgi:uncharacterized protein